jgi:two-component system sensor kinase FixL
MMAEKPSYEELQLRVRELEASKAAQSPNYDILKNLFDFSLDMLCMASLDGYFRIVNAAFETTLGYSRQLLLKKPLIEFVHPDDKAATSEALRLLTSGAHLPYFENRFRCDDGAYKWLAWTCSAVTGEGLLYAVARDITAQKILQGELESQRGLLENVLSNVPASIFWKDRNSVFLGVNNRFAREAGFNSPEEIIGKSDYDLAWTREEADFYRECDREVMDSGTAMLNIEETQRQADGTEVNLLTNKVPLLDTTGQVSGMLGIYIDISKLKQVENTLRKSEARLQTLFDSAAEFILVIDPEGRILNANRHVYEQSGYEENEVIGKNIKGFFSNESQAICECNFPTLRERGYNRADIEFVCKDGRILQMECAATAVPDEEGNFTTFLIIQRDVTERKRASTALAISEQRFRTIFNSSYQLFGILAPDGTLLDANQTALDLGGLKREDVIGRLLWDTYWWRYSTEVQERLKAAIMKASQGQTVRYEEEALDRDQNIRTIDFTLKPVVNQQGETVLIIPEGGDITEKKQAEEESQRHHQELAHVIRLSTAGEMASGMAHELNQPLTAIVSYCGTAQSLVNSLPEPPQQLGDLLGRASEQAHRAGSIIRHLREFIGKGNSDQELWNINEVVWDVLIFLKYDLQKSDVKVEFRPGCVACKVKANKIQIEQVLINMIRNSIEAIMNAQQSNGQIALRTRLLANNSVEVTVGDNGPGVDAAMVDTIFNPFQTSKESGMGIGLSLSRSIIESHNGRLWVDKNHQRGALFGFELPVSE